MANRYDESVENDQFLKLVICLKTEKSKFHILDKIHGILKYFLFVFNR